MCHENSKYAHSLPVPKTVSGLHVSYLPLFTIIYHYLPLFTIIYHYLPSFTIIYNHLPSFTIIYHHLPLFTIIYSLPLSFKHFELIQSGVNELRNHQHHILSLVFSFLGSIIYTPSNDPAGRCKHRGEIIKTYIFSGD